MRRCPACNSIWVCWNWFHTPIGKMIKLNPHMTREELMERNYGHECWSCGDDIGGHCFTTREKVRDGVPYELLSEYGRREWECKKLLEVTA